MSSSSSIQTQVTQKSPSSDGVSVHHNDSNGTSELNMPHLFALSLSVSSPSLFNSLTVSSGSSDTEDLSEPEGIFEEDQRPNLITVDSNDENDVDDETMSGENDVEYAEFSMAQRMLVREPSPTGAVGVTSPTRNDRSFEDKIMLFDLLDRHGHSASSTLEPDPSWSHSTITNQIRSGNDCNLPLIDLTQADSPVNIGMLNKTSKPRKITGQSNGNNNVAKSFDNATFTEIVYLDQLKNDKYMCPLLESLIQERRSQLERRTNHFLPLFPSSTELKEMRKSTDFVVPKPSVSLLHPSTSGSHNNTSQVVPADAVFGTNSAFSWTPSLLSQRKVSGKSSKGNHKDGNKPEKENKKNNRDKSPERPNSN